MNSGHTTFLMGNTNRMPSNNKVVAIIHRNMQRLAHLYACCSKFSGRLGVPKGMRLLIASIAGKKELSVQLPDLLHPLIIRPRTSDRFVFEQIFIDEDYDIPIPTSPRFIVDAGANVGFASIYFANKYPGVKIIALEPAPENFALLLRNTCHYPGIIPLQAALWWKSEPLRLSRQRDSWACRVEALAENETDAIPGITMVDLLRRFNQSSIDILKMDIEGAEYEVFTDDYLPWLVSTGALIVELHDRFRPGCSSALGRATRNLDFRLSKRGENTILMNNAVSS
jgi:FkbM family methyltransferase